MASHPRERVVRNFPGPALEFFVDGSRKDAALKVLEEFGLKPFPTQGKAILVSAEGEQGDVVGVSIACPDPGKEMFARLLERLASEKIAGYSRERPVYRIPATSKQVCHCKEHR